MTLPGVGRKTANVVASITWGEPVIAVDTHVFRVSRRIGLSSGKTPLAVEKDLEEDSLRNCARKHTTGSSCTADTPARHKPKCESCPSHSCKHYKASTAELLLESFYLVIGISTLGPEIELDFRFRA